MCKNMLYFFNSFKCISLSNIHHLYIYIAVNFKIHRFLKHTNNIYVNSDIKCYVRIPCFHIIVKEDPSFFPSAFPYVSQSLFSHFLFQHAL